MFRVMFCMLIALLLPACDQGGPQETNQTSATPSPETSEANATNDTYLSTLPGMVPSMVSELPPAATPASTSSGAP